MTRRTLLNRRLTQTDHVDSYGRRLDQFVVADAVSAASPIPVATNGFYPTIDSTLQTAAGTSRTLHSIAEECTDIRLKYAGAYVAGSQQDVDFGATMNIKASIRTASTNYPLTFGGKLSAVLDPGGQLTTDPFPALFAAGTLIEVLTYTDSTAWYASTASYDSSLTGGWSTSDLTALGASAVPDAVKQLFGPTQILGLPTTRPRASIVIVGDSIAVGWGIKPYSYIQSKGYGGFLARGMYAAGHAASTLAKGGQRANQWKNLSVHMRRLASVSRMTHMVSNLGVNDVQASVDSLATIQANLVTCWRIGSTRGMKVIQTTITPVTGLSGARETIRTGLNDWLRDGAPVDGSLAPVAVGASGTRAGQTGHPLTKVWEVADIAESARNSGTWASGYTTDGTHPNTVGDAALMAAVNAADLLL